MDKNPIAPFKKIRINVSKKYSYTKYIEMDPRKRTRKPVTREFSFEKFPKFYIHRDVQGEHYSHFNSPLSNISIYPRQYKCIGTHKRRRQSNPGAFYTIEGWRWVLVCPVPVLGVSLRDKCQYAGLACRTSTSARYPSAKPVQVLSG